MTCRKMASASSTRPWRPSHLQRTLTVAEVALSTKLCRSRSRSTAIASSRRPAWPSTSIFTPMVTAESSAGPLRLSVASTSSSTASASSKRPLAVNARMSDVPATSMTFPVSLLPGGGGNTAAPPSAIRLSTTLRTRSKASRAAPTSLASAMVLTSVAQRNSSGATFSSSCIARKSSSSSGGAATGFADAGTLLSSFCMYFSNFTCGL
mmetsp:Transcript_23634/g.74283  ORF Transcript_23634/g.74283 Transcript_23634/m.74283 type:complete len:208 (-) Transcript_23634:1376-1999(-)